MESKSRSHSESRSRPWASNYELIAPHTGDSVYVEHLQSKGEGVYHTCIACPSLEAMRQAKEELSKQGREMIQSRSLGELGEFCYFTI